MVGEFANLAEESELAARLDGGMTAQDLLDQRRAGAWKADDEDGLRNIGPTLRLRQQLDVLPDEELLESVEELLDRIGAVFQCTAFRCELALAGNEVLPGQVIAAESVMQPTALQLPITRQRPRVVDDRKRLGVPACPRQIVGAQEVHFGGRRYRLRAIEQLLGPRQLATRLVQTGPVGQGLHVPWSQLVGLGEVALRLVGAPLFQQGQGEVHENRSLRGRQLQGAAEVPLGCRKIVQLRYDQTEQVVRLRVARARTQCRASDLLCVGELAMRQEQLDQRVVSPVRVRIDADHCLQRARSFPHLPTPLLDDGAQLERVHISPGALQTLFRGCFDGSHVAALQGFPATENERMRRCRHERALGDWVQTRVRRPAMVRASGLDV